MLRYLGERIAQSGDVVGDVWAKFPKDEKDAYVSEYATEIKKHLTSVLGCVYISDQVADEFGAEIRLQQNTDDSIAEINFLRYLLLRGHPSIKMNHTANNDGEVASTSRAFDVEGAVPDQTDLSKLSITLPDGCFWRIACRRSATCLSSISAKTVQRGPTKGRDATPSKSSGFPKPVAHAVTYWLHTKDLPPALDKAAHIHLQNYSDLSVFYPYLAVVQHAASTSLGGTHAARHPDLAAAAQCALGRRAVLRRGAQRSTADLVFFVALVSPREFEIWCFRLMDDVPAGGSTAQRSRGGEASSRGLGAEVTRPVSAALFDRLGTDKKAHAPATAGPAGRSDYKATLVAFGNVAQTDSRWVRDLAAWLNAIHYWGATDHGRSIVSDLTAYVRQHQKCEEF